MKAARFNQNETILDEKMGEKNIKPLGVEYFSKMCSDEQEFAKNWHSMQNPNTYEQEKFLNRTKSIKRIHYDYSIVTMEASIKNGKIYYAKGNDVARGLRCDYWEIKAKEFAPEYDSGIANLDELMLWYIYRCAKGYWTLEYICDDSSSAGNYWNCFNASHKFEVSGARTVGGANDGVGNTFKIAKAEFGFALCGGSFSNYGNVCPVAAIHSILDPDTSIGNASAVLVLRKQC